MIDQRTWLAALSALAILVPCGTAPAQTAPAETPAPPAGYTAPSPAAENGPAPAAEPQADTAASPGVATGPQDAEAAVAGLPPELSDVQVVGPWTEGERRGNWRVVMLQSPGETAGSRLFIQQIEEGAGGLTVAATTEITEVAEIEGAVVEYRADEPAEGQESSLALFFDIVPLDGEIAETYELFFTQGAPYIFGPASN